MYMVPFDFSHTVQHTAFKFQHNYDKKEEKKLSLQRAVTDGLSDLDY